MELTIRQYAKWKGVAPVFLGALLSICLSLAASAEIKPDLLDSHLEVQYDWAMYIEARDDVKHYLNYPDSRLSPLTNVRITYRALPRNFITGPQTAATRYEEFWYHDGKPVGLRRYHDLQIQPNRVGTIIVGLNDDNPEHSLAVANALVRLSLDLALKDRVASVVTLPLNKYRQITADLGRYGFFPFMKVMNGQQMSIHLRSYPNQLDDWYYFQKGY